MFTTTSPAAAASAAAALLRLQARIEVDGSLVDEASGEVVHLRISGGVAAPNPHTRDAEQVLISADAGLYTQKVSRSEPR